MDIGTIKTKFHEFVTRFQRYDAKLLELEARVDALEQPVEQPVRRKMTKEEAA